MKAIYSLIFITTTSIASVSTGDLIKASKFNNSTFQIGDIKQSILTLAKFQSIQGNCWRLMDGTSIVGTDLSILSGLTILPDLVTSGNFLRQAKPTRAVGTLEEDAIRNITGSFAAEGLSRDTGLQTASGALYHLPKKHGAYGGTGYNGSAQIGLDASLVVPTADENRPKNMSVNMFIKVNNSCD